MKLRVLGCSGSEGPGGRPGSYLAGERTVFEMGCAASALDLEHQARVDDVFLTHAHLDHVKDLAFLAENVIDRRPEPVRVHAPKATIEVIARHLLNDVLWPDFTRLPDPGRPTLRYQPLDDEPVALEGLQVSWVAVDHTTTCVAYLLDSGDGVLALCGDTGPTDALWRRLDDLGERLRGIVIECSFPDRLRDLAGRSGHLVPAQLAEELGKLSRDDLPVHVTHVKAPTRDETHADLEALGDPRITVLEDGAEIGF